MGQTGSRPTSCQQTFSDDSCCGPTVRFLFFCQELKFPARGTETNPSSWPWFYRMNEAMEGRLAGAAPILTPIVEDEDEDCEPLSPTPKKRARRSRGGMAEFLTESEIDLLVDHEDKNGSSALGELQKMTEFTYKCEH